MNVLDIVILILFVPGIIRGITKGFIEQAVSLAGIIAAVWLSYKYYGGLAQKLSTMIEAPQAAVNVVSFVIILLAAILVVIIIAKVFTGITKMANLNWINRLLGVVLAIAVSAVVISLLIILFETVNTKLELTESPIISQSLLYGTLKDFGNAIFPYLKELGGLVHTESIPA